MIFIELNKDIIVQEKFQTNRNASVNGNGARINEQNKSVKKLPKW